MEEEFGDDNNLSKNDLFAELKDTREKILMIQEDSDLLDELLAKYKKLNKLWCIKNRKF